MLPKMNWYSKIFGKTKYMSFLVKDNKLLKKYNQILDKTSYNINKEIDCKLVIMKNIKN